MIFVRSAQVHNGEHHEQEGLQGDYQYVEDRPAQAGKEMHAKTPPGGGGAQQCDQHEHQLAGEHVAEQSHAVRHGFGDEFNHLEHKIEGPQNGVRTEGGCGQLMKPAAKALDFDVVVNTNEQNRDRQAQCGGQVGCRHNAEIMDAAVKAVLSETNPTKAAPVIP